MDQEYFSLYYEALWVLSLFAATATLREAIGELCVHSISYSILSCSHISGKTLDAFVSCSNGGRSLGFGAAWRMWNIDNSKVISKTMIVLPFCCWAIGMPIKLIAVQAVRGGNPLLGFWGTWTVGIFWIVLCFIVKLTAMLIDRYHGIEDNNGKLLSYRHIFQVRFCRLESYGMMFEPTMYDTTESFLQPIPNSSPLGVDINWERDAQKVGLTMKLVRRDGSDVAPNGLANALRKVGHEHEHELESLSEGLLEK